VTACHVTRLEEAFGARFLAAHSPAGAALFGLAREGGGEDLYFTPRAAALAPDLLTANGGCPSDPLVDEGTVSLLVGHRADLRLLGS
jgi:hypothetical protein